MSTPSLDRYAEAFERLAALPREEREDALHALPMDEGERILLRRMLDADADQDDPLARALGEAAAQLAMPRHDRLGPYRLLHELGAGGMGTVFLAERVDGGFAQQVAIKLLRGFPTADGLRRLRQERQILVGLDHPNIARLIDGGETLDGQPWLALEYIDGLPLPDHAAQHAPRLRDRLALFGAVLDAVGHAHQCLVIHRDIKPANVLVSTAGEVKLLDFGIARLVDPVVDDAGNDTSTRVFSAGYASPEQRAGGAITTASDIYSLGILLRELVRGATKSSAPDAELQGILAKATDENPARRYASAGEFRDDLERYRDGRPVRAARLTSAYRLRKFIGRHRLGAMFTLLSLVALGLFVWRLDHERTRAVFAELAASRDAQRAREALTFLTEAFQSAAPGNAQGQTVSVHELLDKAAAKIGSTSTDPVVAASIQRMLGRMYDALGEQDKALEYFRQGLEGDPPDDREQALELARDMDQYANLLGMVDRSAEARTVIEAAAQLREAVAPDDSGAQVRSLFSRAVWHQNAGEGSAAIPLFRQVLASSSPNDAVPDDLAIRASAFLASQLTSHGSCAEAIDVADGGLQRLHAESAPSPQRLWLLRTRASALRACGRPADAENVLRELIAYQSRLVGDGGMAMLQIKNELSITLNDQGRYREAAMLMEQAQLPEGLGPYNRAALLANLAKSFDDAGDYPRALDLIGQARMILDDAGIAPDNDGQRSIARIRARLLALNGQPALAIAALERLREDAHRIDGVESSEYINVTWQLAFVLRLAGQVESVPMLLDEAERFWRQKLPETHRAFGLLRRAQAELAMQAEAWDHASQHLAAAAAIFGDASAPPGDIAGVQVVQARVALRQGQRDRARRHLAEALPVLRDALLPGHVDRVEAERLARQLGL
ncbi:serine/threonine-protein kinase [Xanthomonadaceae bacterium JHOS43]|nr:serine/threonine-protein kinase [Xanthomonadaceae bacterium JHOS43]